MICEYRVNRFGGCFLLPLARLPDTLGFMGCSGLCEGSEALSHLSGISRCPAVP